MFRHFSQTFPCLSFCYVALVPLSQKKKKDQCFDLILLAYQYSSSPRIAAIEFKILFKSLKYIQNSLKSVLKYSWFGKG